LKKIEIVLDHLKYRQRVSRNDSNEKPRLPVSLRSCRADRLRCYAAIPNLLYWIWWERYGGAKALRAGHSRLVVK
jgi:hypothetical protein